MQHVAKYPYGQACIQLGLEYYPLEYNECYNKHIMRKILVLILAILVLGALLILIYPYTKKKATVIINNQKFSVEVARTQSQQEKGLSGRGHLDHNSGMLFVFEKSDIYSFWMKDTLVPLDIIWIDNNQIVEMTTLNPPIGDNIPEYTPKNKAKYVLELPAGTKERYNFKAGDPVEIKY